MKVSQEEKEGGQQRSEQQKRGFREVLETIGLFDLGCKRDRFKWSNKHSDDTFTKERLDRVVANNLWVSTFSNTSVGCRKHTIEWNKDF